MSNLDDRTYLALAISEKLNLPQKLEKQVTSLSHEEIRAHDNGNYNANDL